MSTSQSKKKVIWAIDPFEDTLKTRSQLIDALRHISKEQNAWVEPVHVLNLTVDHEDNSEVDQSELSRLKQAAIKATQSTIQDIQGIDFLPPRVLMVEDSTSTGVVQTFVNYANTTHAVLIVTATHARQGLNRLFLGSFAETLILQSKLPVITIGPQCLDGGLQDQILFATDFDSYSVQVYRRVVNFAQTLKAKITLFHVIPHRLEPVLQSGAYLVSGTWVNAPEYLSGKEDQKQKLADQWVQEAQEKGVNVKVHLEFGRGDISELILKEAKTRNVGWIAMAAESGVVSATLIGSITRQVVRHSHCPVWVLKAQESSEMET